MSLWAVRNNYKVFVTKDFPRIYEQRIHFEGNDVEQTTAIIREGYGQDDPYVGDHYTPPEVLKPGEWFWEFKDAKKDWNRRRKELIADKLARIKRLQAEVEELESSAKPKRSEVDEGEFCEPYPDGKQEQIDRLARIEKKWEKKRLEEEVANHKAALEKKQERLQRL